MHENDQWLARIVAVGLIVLAGAALISSAVLRAKGIEASEITGVAAGGVGALAAFFAGVGYGKGSRDVSPDPVAPSAVGSVVASPAPATSRPEIPVAPTAPPPTPPATDVRHI